MEDPPNKKDIERAIGEELAEEISIECVESLPPPESAAKEGYILKLIGFITDKWKIFAKTKFGIIVQIYCVVHSLGAPITSPYDIIFSGPSKFSDSAPIVFDYLRSASSDAISYLARLPGESPEPEGDFKTKWAALTSGTTFYPLSADIQKIFLERVV